MQLPPVLYIKSIATGERLFTKYDFKRLLQLGGVDIIQPDLSHAGGITEVRKIAAVSYNAIIQEQSIGIHYNEGKSVLVYI